MAFTQSTTQSTEKTQVRFKAEHITLSIVVLLLAIGALFDKPISHAIMNQGSIFGTIFQNYGLIFPNIVIFMAVQVFYYRIQKTETDRFGKLAVLVLAVVASIYETWQAVKMALFYTVTSLNNVKKGLPIGAANNDGGGQSAFPSWYMPTLVGATIVLVILGTVLCYKWLASKDEAEMKRLTYVALAGIVVVFAADTLVNSMKALWGRFRPYEMNAHWSNFTSWLQINGDNGHKSFPSGHSQEGWIALFLPLFVAPQHANKRRNTFIFAVAFGTLMAFSRLRIGAHFLSDVTMGSFISILVIYAAARILNEKLAGDVLDY
ncbi:MAG: phosphatase PAP2 family protein [Streptococcaceae bacterium]|jgi:membrane-associated phospholipid phosphatase|nr:phosphatase PAP2 family protein [Streptococcaceae bacterium]